MALNSNDNNYLDFDYDNEKEQRAIYSLDNVDFNLTTRITRLEFTRKQKYRTIVKYVTRNYVKYPVYSEWKTRTKKIKKTIKLSNLELENLEHNDDSLIAWFAYEIVSKLPGEELLPSWYLNKKYLSDLKNEFDKLTESFEKYKNLIKSKIKEENTIVNSLHSEIVSLNNVLKKKQKKACHYRNKINGIENAKPNFAKKLFSFGFYSYYVSLKRKNRLLAKELIINNNILKLESELNSKKEKIALSNAKIDSYNKQIKQKEAEIKKKKEEIKLYYNRKIQNIKPLNNLVNNDESFVSLKMFSGLEYEKIVGCYIIHNKENDKYYVGQSKDILKRLKQHFKGTVPLNPIFAEDYYNSQYPNKDDLFEVKIIRCNTKDELDNTEKQLISDYDSWKNGYNGTSGNI